MTNNDAHIGAATRATDSFSRSLLSDLDVNHGGFRSWQGHIDQPRIILISDYLISTARQIQASIISCKLHKENFDQKWFSHCHDLKARISGRETSLRGEALAMSERELERLYQINQHIKGFFVDAGTILDSLGAVFVGVLAIKMSITEAAWSNVTKSRNWLGQKSKYLEDPRTSGRQLQEQVIRELAATTPQSPVDWLEWTLDLRNALTHRGLRLSPMQVYEDKREWPKFAYFLPLNPKFTDVEAFARGKNPEDAYLSEHAGDTISAILGNLAELVVCYMHKFTEVWEMRMRDNTALIQPGKQWPELELTPALRFQGSGKSIGIAAGHIRINSDDHLRWQAAKLQDADNDVWRDLKRSPSPGS